MSEKISIGILSYKRMDFLIQTISDLIKIERAIDLIILNNNESYDFYNEIRDLTIGNNLVNIVYIWDKVNYGVSCGRRKIVESCKTKFLILFDDDIHCPDINVITDKVIYSLTNDNISGIAFNIFEYGTNIHNKYEIPHKNKKINMTESFYTYIMIGAAFAVNVDDVRRVGNFPDDFGMYGFEEVDLSFRLINAGLNIKYIPECIIFHKKSPDGRFSNKDVNFLGYVNRVRMAKRYFHFKYFITSFVVRSVFFVFKTKDIKLMIKGIVIIFSDKKEMKFSKVFYDYIKSVRGFIYY
ncbi:glycosyltransferase family 2 protein [Pectobacterium carotovorum]|uniref:glycosyltransferase family 2 protein n=1 Tax=Pectobacterium carotovorum TaxID=554 RepID=UPI003018CAAA